MADILYVLAIIGALALGAGGIWVWKRDRRRALLLLAAAAITLLNVLSWSTMPRPGVAEMTPP